ncbi:probable alpha,alpha-trehalose-phosphate synthase [UDP-forming] 4 isoform X2 [Spinacia oleracea]|uniref:Probable alpha,alpha-trehalose-phosphate synthase [UDP-forming] 4 isoform X2 n=1 Tax=Spinacia oleracea TaxID=3562 RepID=A0ABM3QGV8_SPIOL|nr:probable alpha,alpha-trehalose-phosphate synthase [UDP-forming] 4 isoform X2 [Spinacia oleracea]
MEGILFLGLERVRLHLVEPTKYKVLYSCFVCPCSKAAPTSCGVASMKCSRHGDQKLESKVHEIVGRVNGRFGTFTSVPIHHLDHSLDFHALCALYALTGSLGMASIPPHNTHWFLFQRSQRS